MEFRIHDSLHQLERSVGVSARVVIFRGRACDVGRELGSDRFGEFFGSGSVLGVSSRDLEAAEHRDRFRNFGDLRAESFEKEAI